MDIYIWLNEQQNGPYAEDDIHELLNAGQLTSATLYWCEGMAEWAPLHDLFPSQASAQEPIPPPLSTNPESPTRGSFLREIVSGLTANRDPKGPTQITQVPWYRRRKFIVPFALSGVVIPQFLILQAPAEAISLLIPVVFGIIIFTSIIALISMVILATGKVFSRKTDASGKLLQIHSFHRWVAVIILASEIFLPSAKLATIVNQMQSDADEPPAYQQKSAQLPSTKSHKKLKPLATPTVSQVTHSADELDQGAISCAENMVYKALVAPATSRFGSETIVYKEPPWYQVRVVVDAQNSFGALIRSRYICTLKMEPDGKYCTYNQQQGVAEDSATGEMPYGFDFLKYCRIACDWPGASDDTPTPAPQPSAQ
ncbi:MAG: GYF domain-containing protein [Chthoniobacteraceae bacterium]